MTSHLSNVWFSVTPLQVASGKGCWVTTTDGEEYLDFAAGIAVNSTGHAHPHVAKAIAEQAQRFIHAQVNVYKHDLLEPLAAKLSELSPGSIDTFFFANSGAEITEAAIKLAKQVTKRPHTIVFSGSFHGRTHMAMAMTTSKTGYRAGHCAAARRRVRRPVPRSARRRSGRRGGRGAEGLRPPAEVDDRARRDGGRHPRAGARRGWLHPGAAGVHRRPRRALPPARHPVHRRRGAERLRSHRQDVRRRALRHRARHHLHGQGHRQRLPVLGARHPARARRQVADGQPRRHLRRQRDRLRGGAGHDRGDERTRLPRERRRPRRAAAGRHPRIAARARCHRPGAWARA